MHQIHIKGARTHNLKNIEVKIPHNQLVVITGLSGSGKSTLAFDTLFAEGQRRYVESLSAYARQFLGRVHKPEVDFITGIAPAIAIEQKVSTTNSRSTVGTSTEVYDYLRLLFARVGRTYSPVSGKEVNIHYVSDIVGYITALSAGTRIVVAAPMHLATGQGMIEKLTLLLRSGIQYVYHDGQTLDIEENLESLSKTDPGTVKIVVDRGRSNHDDESVSRFNDSVARALDFGNGACVVVNLDDDEREQEFSTRFEQDGITFEQPSEYLFSFNNPLGACPKCGGSGRIIGIDEDLVVPEKSRTIYDEAIAAWRGETMRAWKDRLVMNADQFGFPIHTPYYELTKEQKALLWTGNSYFEGLNEYFQFLEREKYKIQYRVILSRYTGSTLCPVCHGSRLRPEALYVRVGEWNIARLVAMPIEELHGVLSAIRLEEHEKKVAQRVMTELTTRLQYLIDVGLGYLTLDRLSSTLSGGESQRINLATSLGSNLTGSLYILDEPSIGLHPRDTHKLIHVLKQLRDLGNTVIVVEHEEEIIRAADRIIDIGPGAGYKGGEVVFSGTLPELEKAKGSLTADYLMHKKTIEPSGKKRLFSRFITIEGARENNLKGMDVRIPVGVMTCITGVSGSGKSSLVKGILYPALRRELYETGTRPGNFLRLSGDYKKFKAVEMVDQNPIGKSSRSNPVTFIKAYDEIRKLYSDQPYAKTNNLTPSHFSFNMAGGRCEECQGEGVIRVGMQFMADVELTCESCGGKRFKDEILEVRYKGRSIYDLLEMTVDEAVDFFAASKEPIAKRIIEKLKVLQDVGLGYVKLGQSSSTLSGGESQRVKLASFLLKENAQGEVLFIFDEPTTGLHFHDIKKLLSAFNALVDKGHTLVVVEHNMDVIKCADWVIDLGPEAGTEGGHIVFEGHPGDLAACKESYTGQFLSMREKL